MLAVAPNDWHKDPNSLRGNRLRVEEPPAWVTRRKVKNFARMDGQPVTMLLLDRQINPDRMSRYTRYVRRLETPQSVQDAGRIELSFDPATQVLLIHAISIFRDGKLTNLADLEEIKIIQREQQLDIGIYDGNITALILLKDLRTGDLIDIETSITSDDAVFPSHYWFEENFGHILPVGRQYFSWLSAEQGKFRIEETNLDIVPYEEETPEGIRKTWEQGNQSAIILPPFLPLGFNPFRRISITSFRSWQEVAAEVSRLWTRSEKPGAELPMELASIRVQHTNPPQLIDALVAFVRDNIRYQGVETGRLGLVPEELHTIWERRYGDCKEKTSLLCWMLRECGFNASPALVSTVLRARIAEMIPGPIFDHVVVHLRHDGIDHWIDPTDVSLRGKLEDWISLPFGKALLISPESKDFLSIANSVPGKNILIVHEDYSFPRGNDDAEIKVTHTYRGTEANRVRHAINSQGRIAVQQHFADIVRSTRANAELKTDLEIIDEEEANVVILRAEFTAAGTLAQGNVAGSRKAEFIPHSIAGNLTGLDDRKRDHPLALLHPIEIKHSTVLRHSDSKGAVVPKVLIDNEFIKFVASTGKDGEFPSLDYHYLAKAPEIPVDALHRYRTNLKQISQVISLIFETSSSGRSAGSKSRRSRSSSWEQEELNPAVGRGHGYHYSSGTSSGPQIPYWVIGILVIFVIRIIIMLLSEM